MQSQGAYLNRVGVYTTNWYSLILQNTMRKALQKLEHKINNNNNELYELDLLKVRIYSTNAKNCYQN